MGAASLTKERSIAPPQITLSKRAAQLSPHLAKKAADGRLPLAERMMAAESAEAMAVALAQPHRAGSDDPWLAFPLGRFCRRTWVGDDRRTSELRNACFGAGNDYATEIRIAKIARGEHVEGVYSESRCVNSADLPDDPKVRAALIAAAKAAIEAADGKVRRANECLLAIMPRLPRAMERLCCASDPLDEPSPYDEGMLRAGLWRLAGHYGLLDRGINGLKEF